MPTPTSAPPVGPGWMIRLCRPSRMLWLAPLLGFVLTLPSLCSGYVFDDHLYRQQSLATTTYFKRPVWDRFNWVSTDAELAHYRERGILATWSTPDGARSRFFRPLASLVHALELRFFGDAPWVMHLGLALLYALLIFLCAELLTRLSSSPAAMGIACLLFAVDDVHAYTSGWIAGHNTLLCCVFGLWALLMHERWRRAGSRAALALFALGFILSLLSSEGGLALMGYLVAYAMFLEPGTWRRRIVTLIPGVTITLGYLLFYGLQHYGSRSSFGYLSPLDDPWKAAVQALSGTATYSLSQILSFPPLTFALSLSGGLGVIVAAVLLGVVVFLLRRFLASSPRVAFFAAGMVLSMVPFTWGMMGDRLLLWASLGAAGLLGELFAVYAATRRSERALAKGLLVTNTALSLVFFVPTLYWLSLIESSIQKLEATVTSQDTVILNTPWLSCSTAAAIRYERGGQWPDHVYPLYEGTETLTVKRTGERTLVATTPKGWFSSYLEKSTRPRQLYVRPGQAFDLELMRATVEEVTDDDRPLRVSFTFKRVLEELAWIKLTPRGPERCPVPALGEELRVGIWPF